MTQPNKREELAAMRLEEFKEHLARSLVDLRNKSAAHHDRVQNSGFAKYQCKSNPRLNSSLCWFIVC